MNSLLDNDTEDELDDRPVRARDREITLGTTVVLGIFFALAAYGAVLFGFGYSMGAKHAAGSAAAESASATTFGGLKPAPGSPLGSAESAVKPSGGPTVTIPEAAAAVVPPRPVPVRTEAMAEPDDAAPTNPVPQPRPVPTVAKAVPPPASAAPAQPAQPALATLVQPSATGSFLVQVAAVSHQEDADLLVVTLKRHGYAVVAHHEPQDSLLHVQIGNFSTKKDAEAMRQRLLADGFNAIVK